MAAMGLALTTAISGLQATQARFAAGAAQVSGAVSGSSSGVELARSESVSSPLRPSNIRPPVFPDNPDLIGGIVELKAAENGYKAAAQVLATIAEIENSLLDILS